MRYVAILFQAWTCIRRCLHLNVSNMTCDVEGTRRNGHSRATSRHLPLIPDISMANCGQPFRTSYSTKLAYRQRKCRIPIAEPTDANIALSPITPWTISELDKTPNPAARRGPARPRCKNRPGRISAARPGRGQNLLARLGRKFLNGPRRAGPAHSVSRHNAKLSTVMYISIFPCNAELNPFHSPPLRRHLKAGRAQLEKRDTTVN